MKLKINRMLIRNLIFTSIIVIAQACGTAKTSNENIVQIVNASCGTCQFGMTGDECELAVEIDQKYYYVEGAAIDEFGDAHADDGFCNTVRKANVSGVIKHGVFVVSSFDLLPQ
jgi:hypothetical protein